MSLNHRPSRPTQTILFKKREHMISHVILQTSFTAWPTYCPRRGGKLSQPSTSLLLTATLYMTKTTARPGSCCPAPRPQEALRAKSPESRSSHLAQPRGDPHNPDNTSKATAHANLQTPATRMTGSTGREASQGPHSPSPRAPICCFFLSPLSLSKRRHTAGSARSGRQGSAGGGTGDCGSWAQGQPG